MRRNRWIKRALAGLLALGTAGGCKQQLFMEPGDYKDALLNSLPKGLETNPHDTIVPDQVDRAGPGPATVMDPERTPRMITLKECIAVALEQGNTGVQGQQASNFGFKNEAIEQFNGRTVGGSDAIRVFALDPAVAAAELERSLSKFDARWVTSMQWQKVDQPTAAQFLSFQNSRDAATLNTTLSKPLPTGGTAGITFSTDYSKFSNTSSNAGFVNPNYTPRLQFSFEQPLLRQFGVEVNQLAASHPGSLLNSVGPSGGQGTEGILISRIRLDQQKADFEVKVNFLLVNVETAYWNLVAAYYNLYAQEEGLRQSYEGYRFIQIRVEAGTDPPPNLEQSRAQFERFRRLVYQARGQVLEAERNLRGLMGLRSDDGTRLVPIDTPSEAPYKPDFYEAANEALTNRPELLLARQDLKANQLNLLLQRNLRRPDLRTFATYDIAGLGTQLDGSAFTDPGRTVPGNALTSFVDNNFNSWTLGFRLDVPLGFRDANAQVRQAQLALTRSYYQLRDSEMKTLEYLVSQYRRLVQAHAEIGPAQAERVYLQRFLYASRELIKLGKWDSSFFQQYLTVQRDLATAIAVEYRAIADYNSALAAFEFAKGTIQRYNNVTVGEGPLPPWVSKKAADHIRERTEAAIKLRERDAALGSPGTFGGASVGPPTGTAFINTLPPYAEKREPAPETLPEPRPVGPKGDKNPAALPIPLPLEGGATGRPPVPVVPGAVRPQAAAPAVPPGDDYFRPAGTATVAPPARTPAAARMAAPPAPLPLPGDLAPAGGTSPVPPPPATRYPPR